MKGIFVEDRTTDTPESSDSNDVRVDHTADVETKAETEAETEAVVNAQAENASADEAAPRGRRSIVFSLRSLVVATVIALLIGAVGTMTWLYVGAERRLDAQNSLSVENARAEELSLDYAVKAASMDFNDLQAWKVELVEGTTQQLNDKLSEAAKSMEQVLVPLQWTSTAEPLVAKVRSKTGGIIVVDCFVSVQTKTVQSPEALQSTATYAITIDTNNNWLITDVGGIAAVVGPK
jgi:hypothetical protein